MSAVNNKETCPIFGDGCDLPENVLPTYTCVYKYYNFLKNKKINSKEKVIVQKIVSEISTKILGIWAIALIPTVTKQRTVLLVEKRISSYLNLLKMRGKYKEKTIEEFVLKSENLLDLSACKCTHFDNCHCAEYVKVPPSQQKILMDQRSERKMIIRNIDIRRYEKPLKIHTSTQTRQDNKDLVEIASNENLDALYSSSDSLSDADASDVTYTPSKRASNSLTINKLRLTNLSMALDRYGISNRARAAIATATLQDFGVISRSETKNIIDKNKFQRERERVRNSILSENSIGVLKSIYFDGRKDRTLALVDGRRRVIVEEHIVMLSEPGSKYVTHMAPENGTSKAITSLIYKYLEDNCLLADLRVIGCDGTNTNTGNKGTFLYFII